MTTEEYVLGNYGNRGVFRRPERVTNLTLFYDVRYTFFIDWLNYRCLEIGLGRKDG